MMRSNRMYIIKRWRRRKLEGEDIERLFVD